MSPVGLIGHAYFPMPMARPRDLQFVATVQSTAARRSTLCQESRLTLLSVVMGKLASWSEDAEAARRNPHTLPLGSFCEYCKVRQPQRATNGVVSTLRDDLTTCVCPAAGDCRA